MSWLGVIGLAALAALFVPEKAIYVTLYALAAAYFGSRRLLRYAFGRLECERRLDRRHIFHGEQARVTLILRNPTRIPIPWVLGSDEVSHNLSAATDRRTVTALAPGGRAEWSYAVVGRRRGYWQVGPTHLEAGDPFGFERLRGRAGHVASIVVYPRVHRLERLRLPSQLPFGEIRTREAFFEDPSRVVGVRAYQPGDPTRRIHWKLSARAGALQVKEFQPTIALETYILLNMNEREYGARLVEHYSEIAVETAASIAFYLHRRRQSVGLFTNGRDPSNPEKEQTSVFLPARKGAGQLMRVLELLARIECRPGRPFVPEASERARTVGFGGALIVITPQDTPELAEAAFALSRSGRRLMIVVVGEELRHSGFTAKAPHGVPFFRVQYPSDVERLSARLAGAGP